MATDTLSTPKQSSIPLMSSDRYRGAVVEDLQLPPAFALPSDEAISRAIELAYERDFSQIPVLDRRRKPLGYVDVPALKTKWEAGQANPVRIALRHGISARELNRPGSAPQDDKVFKYTIKFRREPSQPYVVITPWTPLAELELFLQDKLFALVTDWDRKFVLAVVTKQDLENFVHRRGF
ncbi:hypothetical protein BC629DRAFT_82824 [Irpex lacteus]|nr:hypothetical protein BC629DRAFT_82824 [Irpex lacteus]